MLLWMDGSHRYFLLLTYFFRFLSISIAYSAGKVSRVVAHPTPLNDEEQGNLDCRNHAWRMYHLLLLLSCMVNVLCSGDV